MTAIVNQLTSGVRNCCFGHPKRICPANVGGNSLAQIFPPGGTIKGAPGSSLLSAKGGRGMPKVNDLEGRQDMGGKHGGQAGMPKPETRTAAQQGIVRDDKGQEQPADKSRAQQK
jgi:hypothetical protein